MPNIVAKYKPLYTSKKRYFLLTGGRGCFQGNQSIVTNNGNKEISKLKIGDYVKSYNEENKSFEYKKVIKTFEYENDKIYIINLKNGDQIKVTGEHKFYNNGRWVKVKDLLSLWYGDMEENT